LSSGTIKEDGMPFSPEVFQALANVELTLLASFLRSLPFGASALLAAVVLAVSWLCSTEIRTCRAHQRHAGA
jgi:hypothetical protein